MRQRTQPWPNSLSYADRFQAVRRLVARCRKRLIAYPNVVAVGVGIEFRGRRGVRGRGTLRQVRYGPGQDERAYVPCVHVVVSRKWRKHGGAGALPETLSTTVSVDGGRVRVDVPVDVVEARPSRLHVLWKCAATDGVHALSGTGSCFVRQKSGTKQFVLSCHHLLALTEKQYPPSDLSNITVEWSGRPIGQLAFLPVYPDRVDAALASSVPAQPQVVFDPEGDGSVVLGGSLQPDEPLDPTATFYALTQHGVRRVHFVAEVEHTEDYYGDGTPLTFLNVLHCLTLPGEPWLQPGDSGAALVDLSGRLVGIHYAGTNPAGPDSYALRADVVLTSFERPLVLA